MLWTDLEAEPGLLFALEHAGARPEDGNQNEKRGWSERLANACAVAIADELRRVPILKGKRMRPADLKTGTEPLTPLGAGTSKRVDVTVADPLLGLEIGVSLKGLNFADGGSGNYDKNLTGRLYELVDEVRLVQSFLNVVDAPPFRGRPIVESTRGLKDLVGDMVGQAISQDRIDWAHPEAD